MDWRPVQGEPASRPMTAGIGSSPPVTRRIIWYIIEITPGFDHFRLVELVHSLNAAETADEELKGAKTLLKFSLSRLCPSFNTTDQVYK